MWNGVSGALYSVYRSTNLLSAWPGTMMTNAIPGDLTGTNIYIDTNQVAAAAFYTIGVDSQ